MFAALEARVELAPRWRGAQLERLLDEDHGAVVSQVAGRLEALGWEVEFEVTYSEYGERGSIDVLGLRPADRAVVVVEVKTDVASSEGIGRKLDEKARLAPGIVAQRWGWTPASLGRLVVMPDSMRLRRLVERHEVIARMFPVDAVAIRRWLRRPAGAMAGLWFLSVTRPTTQRDARNGRCRPITTRASVDPAAEVARHRWKAPNRPH